MFEKAANGDSTGALERLSRCVEVFERYPGLHRFAMGCVRLHVVRVPRALLSLILGLIWPAKIPKFLLVHKALITERAEQLAAPGHCGVLEEVLYYRLFLPPLTVVCFILFGRSHILLYVYLAPGLCLDGLKIELIRFVLFDPVCAPAHALQHSSALAAAQREHMGHIMIQLAANMDDPRAGDLYQKLRCAFNVTRRPGELPFPPLENWQGISAYCNNTPCRCVQAAWLTCSVHLHCLNHYLGWLSCQGHAYLWGLDVVMLPLSRTCLHRSIPNSFPDRPLDLSLPQPLPEGNTTAGQAEVRDVDSVAQPWPGSASPDAFGKRPESVRWSPLGCSGAVTSPPPALAIDEDSEDLDIAAEDWLEATHALDLALGIASTL